MRGNTNSYNVLGSETKVLNIVQEGTLVRDNLTISGFDNGYFSPASRVSGGILSLDNSTSYSNIIDAMANANSWKLNIKFETGDDISNNQVIIGQLNDNYTTPQIGLWNGGKLNICLSFNGGSWDYDEEYETLSVNTIYYLTLEFTGESYITTLYNSTKTLIATHTITDNTKIYNDGRFCFGSDHGSEYFEGKIYLEETNIEVDGQIGWRVVEIPGRITNIGDEIAVDLLLQQNQTKVALANNLQGLGVSANANTDTLNELAYKVSTVNADDDRQKPKNISVFANSNTQESGWDHFPYGYTIKNGWFLFFYSDGSNLRIKRFKLSAMDVTNYDSEKRLSLGTNNVGTLDNGSYPKFILNDDGSNLYVMQNTSVKKYTIDGYNSNALSVSTATATYTPKFDYGNGYENINLGSFDINSTETQMIVVDQSGNVGIYDLTSSGNQNINIISLNKADMYFANNTNNNLIEIVYVSGGPDTYNINIYSIVDNQLNLLSSDAYIGSTSGNWKKGITKYKDANNNYKLIMNLGNVNSDINPSSIIIDCATLTINSVFSKLNYDSDYDYSNDHYINPPTVYIIDNNYYLLSGMWLAVFDSNWNQIGNVINRFRYDSYLRYWIHTIIYNNEIYDLGENGTYIYAMKHRTWLNKLTVYERTVNKVIDEGTVNERTIQVQIPYYAQLNIDDLDDGVYNQ